MTIVEGTAVWAAEKLRTLVKWLIFCCVLLLIYYIWTIYMDSHRHIHQDTKSQAEVHHKPISTRDNVKAYTIVPVDKFEKIYPPPQLRRVEQYEMSKHKFSETDTDRKAMEASGDDRSSLIQNQTAVYKTLEKQNYNSEISLQTEKINHPIDTNILLPEKRNNGFNFDNVLPSKQNANTRLNFSNLSLKLQKTQLSTTHINYIKHKHKGKIKTPQLSYVTNTTCKPKNRVAFLKIHKTGSSTFAGILQRYGYFHNLSFAFPVRGFTHFSRKGTLSHENMRVYLKGGTPDILYHHVTYNHAAFTSLLPSDMVYVAAIRDPVSWFLSAFLYYKFDKKIQEQLQIYNKSLEFYTNEYLTAPWLYSYKLNAYSTSVVELLDLIAYDYGIPRSKTKDVDYINEYVQKTLANDIHIALITENFYESLILFKRYMCWGTKELFHMDKMVSKKSRPLTLPSEQVEKLRNLAPSLFILYDHFLKQYNKQIENQGSDFIAEVESFKMMLNEVQTYCRSKHKKRRSLEMSSKWSGQILVAKKDCSVLKMSNMRWENIYRENNNENDNENDT